MDVLNSFCVSQKIPLLTKYYSYDYLFYKFESFRCEHSHRSLKKNLLPQSAHFFKNPIGEPTDGGPTF